MMGLVTKIMSPLFGVCLPFHPEKGTRQVLILEHSCMNLSINIGIMSLQFTNPPSTNRFSYDTRHSFSFRKVLEIILMKI